MKTGKIEGCHPAEPIRHTCGYIEDWYYVTLRNVRKEWEGARVRFCRNCGLAEREAEYARRGHT